MNAFAAPFPNLQALAGNGVVNCLTRRYYGLQSEHALPLRRRLRGFADDAQVIQRASLAGRGIST